MSAVVVAVGGAVAVGEVVVVVGVVMAVVGAGAVVVDVVVVVVDPVVVDGVALTVVVCVDPLASLVVALAEVRLPDESIAKTPYLNHHRRQQEVQRYLQSP